MKILIPIDLLKDKSNEEKIVKIFDDVVETSVNPEYKEAVEKVVELGEEDVARFLEELLV